MLLHELLGLKCTQAVRLATALSLGHFISSCKVHKTLLSCIVTNNIFIIFCNFQASDDTGLGAKSQNLSSVAPPRKKKLVTIFSQGHVWGPQKPMFY